jgi:hypothetical protein
VKRLQDGLGVLIALCIVVRVGAWLVQPAIPLLIGLFVLTALFIYTFGRRL